MKARENKFVKTHFCEFEVLSEELNLVACTICGGQPGAGKW